MKRTHPTPARPATTYVVFDGTQLLTGQTAEQAATARTSGAYVIDAELWKLDLRQRGTYQVVLPSGETLPHRVTVHAAAWALANIDGAYGQRVKAAA